MLIVYLPKIFSSVAGLFRLDPLHLLSAGTVLTLEPSVRCVPGVLVCVPHYNEKHAKIYRVNVPTMGQLSNFRALKIHNSPHRCDRDLKPTLFCQN